MSVGVAEFSGELTTGVSTEDGIMGSETGTTWNTTVEHQMKKACWPTLVSFLFCPLDSGSFAVRRATRVDTWLFSADEALSSFSNWDSAVLFFTGIAWKESKIWSIELIQFPTCWHISRRWSIGEVTPSDSISRLNGGGRERGMTDDLILRVEDGFFLCKAWEDRIYL